MDARTLRLSLITRCHAARVIATNKGRSDLAMQCVLKVSALKRAFGEELPVYVDGVAMIERDCRDAITMDEVRARHRQFRQPPAVEATGVCPSAPVASFARKVA